MNNNTPTILTGISVGTGIFTGIYSVWAGYKIAEAWQGLPVDATAIDKAKVAVPYLIPTFVGITVTAGCSIAANRENGKRLAAAGVTIAALATDKRELAEKTKEFLGKDEKGKVDIEKGEAEFKKIEDAIADEKSKMTAVAMGVPTNVHAITAHDKTTGYVWKTNLKQLYAAISDYNNVNDLEKQPISYFYEQSFVPGYVYDDLEPIYNDIYVDDYFNPEIGYEVGPDMQPILTLEWDSQRCNSVPLNKCGGYVY